MKASISITGANEVISRLRYYADKVPENGRKVMNRRAEIILQNAKNYAPEDIGNLVNAIQLERSYGSRGRLQINIFVAARGGELGVNNELKPGDLERYAAFVHENYSGWVQNPSKKTKQKMAMYGADKVGTGFLRTAVDEQRENLEKGLVEAITSVIEAG